MLWSRYFTTAMEMKPELRLTKDFFFFSWQWCSVVPHLHTRTSARNGHLSCGTQWNKELRKQHILALLPHAPFRGWDLHACSSAHVARTVWNYFLTGYWENMLMCKLLLLYKEAQIALLHKGIERSLNVAFITSSGLSWKPQFPVSFASQI